MKNLQRMIDWEAGSLSEEEEASLFQDLIDEGIVWQLQGCYGRRAAALINAGVCHPRKEE